MDRVQNFLKFILSNFGPLIGFYFVNQFWGLKAAVVASLVLGFGEFLWLKRKNEKITAFFYFSSGLIILFGTLDLLVKEPLFIKFEASITNLFFAIFFALSLFKDKSIVQQFAETQKKILEEQSEDKKFFFQVFTLFWCFYFVSKALLYLWINFNSSLNEGLMIRMIVGKISFWGMMVISVGFPKKIWVLMEKATVFPSQRKVKSEASVGVRNKIQIF